MRFWYKNNKETATRPPDRLLEQFKWVNDKGQTEYPERWIAEELDNPTEQTSFGRIGD
jgi:hypothetical protein